MAKGDFKASPVGYCSPPLETRFKQGQSGNPKGRPRKLPRAPGMRDELGELLHGINKVSVRGNPSKLKAVISAQALSRKAVNSVVDISPEAMANSRCLPSTVT